MGALSQQLPSRLIDAVMLYSASLSRIAWLAYWLPRSLLKTTPASGFRVTGEVLAFEEQDKRCEAHIEPESWLSWLHGSDDEAKLMLVAQPAEFYDQADAVATHGMLGNSTAQGGQTDLLLSLQVKAEQGIPSTLPNAHYVGGFPHRQGRGADAQRAPPMVI